MLAHQLTVLLLIFAWAHGPRLPAQIVNGNFTTRIDQVSAAESRKLLDLLFEHVQSPYFQCRYRWTPGTLTLWDNRCLQHYAVPDYEGRRIMHRLTISGDQPV